MTEAITVSRLNTYIKQIFDAEELLHNISVVGEVFGLSLSRNVIYFTLKDEEASLPCVCFYPAFAAQLKEGDKIIVTGNPNFYIKGGKLNFNVSKIEKVGQGKLFEEFIKLKQKLEEEGLFDPTHKKQMPKEIKRIGVITSKDGAVIQDIKNVAWRRNPNIDIVLFNTKVQGYMAENEIAHAIEMMGNYTNIDVIIVARGGGSLEDLWPYNTEIVARATYNCPKPIVSAVGHETDFTIIDFVSDLRAPTPSAAAELITFNLTTKRQDLATQINHFLTASNRFLLDRYNRIQNTSMILSGQIDKTLSKENSNISLKNSLLTTSFERYINQKYYETGLNENTLSKINPLNILDKGYAKVEQQGRAVTTKQELNLHENFKVVFKDGHIIAKIKED